MLLSGASSLRVRDCGRAFPAILEAIHVRTADGECGRPSVHDPRRPFPDRTRSARLASRRPWLRSHSRKAIWHAPRVFHRPSHNQQTFRPVSSRQGQAGSQSFRRRTLAPERQAKLDPNSGELRAGRIGAHRRPAAVSVGNLVTGGTSGNTSLLPPSNPLIRYTLRVHPVSRLPRYAQFTNDGALRQRVIDLTVESAPSLSRCFPTTDGFHRHKNESTASSSTIPPAPCSPPGWKVHTRLVCACHGGCRNHQESCSCPTPPMASGTGTEVPFRWFRAGETSPGEITSRSCRVVDGLRVITPGLTP